MALSTTSMFTVLLYLSATTHALKHIHAPKSLERTGDLTKSPSFSPSRYLNKRALSSNSFAICYSDESCSECFGAGHVDCPSGSYYGKSLVSQLMYGRRFGSAAQRLTFAPDCYDPSEGSVAELCDLGSVSSAFVSSALVPTATAPSTPLVTTDSCSGLSCSQCFGSGYVECPSGSTYDCHDPSDSNSLCDLPGTGASSTASAPVSSATCSSTLRTNADCACTYGVGNIICLPGSCYNPDAGESCCPNGS